MEYFKGLHMECGMAEQYSEKMFAGQLPDDEQFKKELLCVSKKMGMLDEAGNLQVQVMEEQFRRNIPDQSKVNDIVSNCFVQMSSPEETAYEATKCIFKIRFP
nr:odorant binding protein [Semanotus bifasciatus]